MAMNRDVVKNLMKECAEGNLDTEKVLFAALRKLDELGENIVYDLAIENKFIVQEDFLPEIPERDESDRIEKEIEEDLELTAQQKIIEKVLARYGDH
jgi:hypothetical protein